MNLNLKKIPNTPGIYKFFSKSEIIYIGKAKNLKKRVTSYFRSSFQDRKTSQIKILTDKIETFTTKNEVEALLLEQLLIKENKPKFNILLRDDKTYPYIYFSLDHQFPGIYLKRTKQATNSNYFGPFVSSGAVKKSIKDLQKIFKLRNCNDSTFSSRSRPCIEFQMKRCSAPCVGNILESNYFQDVQSAKSYLLSSDSQTIEKLNNELLIASKRLEYEKAAEIRDKLKRIELIRKEQSVVSKVGDIDIFSIDFENKYLGISIIVVRSGKIRGTKTNIFKEAYATSLEDIYQAVIINFYDTQPDIPSKILCSHKLKSRNLIEKVVNKKFKKNTKIIHTPSKSIRPIYNLCKLNAKQIIENHLSKFDKYNFATEELSKNLGLNKTITKIEAFDISHISGDHAVASCVVYTNRGADKKNYRLFNIPKNLAGNDVGSLEYVIERRLKYYDNNIKPNVILIDGGKTQLKYVNNIIKKSEHLDIKVISIVKGSNRVRATETILSDEGVIEFDKNSKAFLLLQEIRDESHRFALNAQRKKKSSLNKKSKLDEINGIGDVLKQRLFLKFKTIKNIKSANLSDLMTVKGINAKIAKLISEKL